MPCPHRRDFLATAVSVVYADQSGSRVVAAHAAQHSSKQLCCALVEDLAPGWLGNPMCATEDRCRGLRQRGLPQEGQLPLKAQIRPLVLFPGRMGPALCDQAGNDGRFTFVADIAYFVPIGDTASLVAFTSGWRLVRRSRHGCALLIRGRPIGPQVLS